MKIFRKICSFLASRLRRSGPLRNSDKMRNRPVIGNFGILRKVACGQFAVIAMIMKTFTANPFAGARFVRAITFFFIRSHPAFHCDLRGLKSSNTQAFFFFAFLRQGNRERRPDSRLT